MAISNINIHQDNKVGDSDLLAVHSPLSFLVDVTYSGAIPDILYCDIYHELELLSTFKCIPYQDLLPNERRFIFIADSIIRGYMGEFDDFIQTENSLVSVPDITKIFELKFRDPDAGVADESVLFTAIQAAKEFGESPNLTEIFNNDSDVYIAAKDKVCYVYFYNSDPLGVPTVGIKQQVTFVVSDLSGFVDGALITINGSVQITDINGEAVFLLSSSTYNYTITKDGYVEKTGSFTVLSSDLTINVTLEEKSLEPVTFVIDKKGFDGIAILNVFEVGGFPTPIATGFTTTLGNTVELNILLPNIYEIEVSLGCWGWEQIYETLELTNLSSPVALAPTVELPDVEITFIVTDSDTGDPIEHAIITKDGVELFGEPCYPVALDTDINGEAVSVVKGQIYPRSLGLLYHCTKEDWSIATGQVNANSSNLNMIVPIELVFENPETTPIVTTDLIDLITDNQFKAFGEVVSDGGSALLTMGFCYAVAPAIPTISGDKVTKTPAVGEYNTFISGLITATEYNVRAYASNAEGLTYGTMLSATTTGNPP